MSKRLSPVVATLTGVFAGFTSAACIIGLYAFASEDIQPPENLNQGYIAQASRNASVDYWLKSAPTNAVMFQGSSELATSAELIPEIPQEVFGYYPSNISLNYIGEAFDQSLWHTQALGALEPGYQPGKQKRQVCLVVSPSWFNDEGIDKASARARFSFDLFRRCMNNPKISQVNKDYISARLTQIGVDTARLHAGSESAPLAQLSAQIFSSLEHQQHAQALRSLQDAGIDHKDVQSQAISFDQWRSWALEDAQVGSTNNDWGYDNAFWSKNMEGRLDKMRNSKQHETLSKSPEYDDFACYLSVAQDLGIEPIVVISPVSGKFYDLIGVGLDKRSACYDRIRDIAHKYQAKLIDFSSEEYTPYFLHDIVHFGWLGWVELEEALHREVSS